jgi:signal transduction histidine kinase
MQPPPQAEREDVEGEHLAGALRALQRAAERVADSWEPEPNNGVIADEVATPVRVLCEAIRMAMGGNSPRLRELPSWAPTRRVLEMLRRSFLLEAQGADETLGMDQVLRLLNAIEQVQHALDEDCAQRFINRLSGPDALQLLVEVAHDMRSPLASILFLAERVRNGQSGAVNPIQERQIGLVYSAAFGLSSLASDVIELARGGDRLIDLHPIPFSITDTLQSVRDIVLPVAEEKGLQVKLTPPESDSRVGHPAALNRVLLNLTTNALKFTAQGCVEVTAKEISRKRIEFSVRDTGRGIPPQVVATLFEAFRRRQKPGEYAFSSAGLGLAICQKLVQAMGGELQVETAVEQGTRFHFQLELPPATKI